MKSIRKSKAKKTKEIVFPILMTHINYPEGVVLFSDETTGTVVSSFGGYKLGHHIKGWENAKQGRWFPLEENDPVTLSND